MTRRTRRRPNKYKGIKLFRDRKQPFKWRAYHRKSGEIIDCTKFEPYTLSFDIEVHRLNEIYKDHEAKVGTLGMLIKKYRASPKFQKRAARTKADYEKCFDWLKPIEDTPLNRFSRGLVAKIRDKAEAQHKFRFANYVRSVLSVIFEWGVEYEYLRENPAKEVSLAERPSNLPDANRPWSDTERDVVLAALPIPMLLPFSLMMFYGLDPQDALALPKSVLSSTGIDTRRNKTGQSLFLPIFEPVAKALEQSPQHEATTLCANSRGKTWTYNGFSTNWYKLKVRLEKEGKIQPGLTLKGLRHTVATILAEMGKDSGTIALVLGHATEAMAKHYSRRADRTRQVTGAFIDLQAELTNRQEKFVKPNS